VIMSFTNIIGIAGTALNAQLLRLNLTSSNIANASTVASSEKEAFRAKRPVFQALLAQEQTNAGAQYVGGVKVDRVVNDGVNVQRLYEPGHPQADANGYIYGSGVNEMSEMVEMMSASRSYQNNVEVANTARELMMKTIDLMKG